MVKRSLQEKTFNLVNGLLMWFMIIITLYPVVYVLFGSLSDSNALLRHSGLLLGPLKPNIKAYLLVFKNPMILRSYANTLFIVIVGTCLNLAMTSIGAFFLSRKNVLWKNAVMFSIIFTMFFSGGMIPFYLTVKSVGLMGSLWAVVVPFAINTFNLILMRTSFAAIPDSLEESARIDGANDIVVLLRIILPMSMPVIAVMTLYYGVERWNGWFYSMVFLQNRSLYPLSLILREILILSDLDSMTAGMSTLDQASIGEAVKYATIVVATLPILFVYPFLQRFFVKGVMIGALKG